MSAIGPKEPLKKYDHYIAKLQKINTEDGIDDLLKNLSDEQGIYLPEYNQELNEDLDITITKQDLETKLEKLNNPIYEKTHNIESVVFEITGKSLNQLSGGNDKKLESTLDQIQFLDKLKKEITTENKSFLQIKRTYENAQICILKKQMLEIKQLLQNSDKNEATTAIDDLKKAYDSIDRSTLFSFGPMTKELKKIKDFLDTQQTPQQAAQQGSMPDADFQSSTAAQQQPSPSAQVPSVKAPQQQQPQRDNNAAPLRPAPLRPADSQNARASIANAQKKPIQAQGAQIDPEILKFIGPFSVAAEKILRDNSVFPSKKTRAARLAQLITKTHANVTLKPDQYVFVLQTYKSSLKDKQYFSKVTEAQIKLLRVRLLALENSKIQVTTDMLSKFNEDLSIVKNDVTRIKITSEDKNALKDFEKRLKVVKNKLAKKSATSDTQQSVNVSISDISDQGDKKTLPLGQETNANTEQKQGQTWKKNGRGLFTSLREFFKQKKANAATTTYDSNVIVEITDYNTQEDLSTSGANITPQSTNASNNEISATSAHIEANNDTDDEVEQNISQKQLAAAAAQTTSGSAKRKPEGEIFYDKFHENVRALTNSKTNDYEYTTGRDHLTLFVNKHISLRDKKTGETLIYLKALPLKNGETRIEGNLYNGKKESWERWLTTRQESGIRAPFEITLGASWLVGDSERLTRAQNFLNALQKVTNGNLEKFDIKFRFTDEKTKNAIFNVLRTDHKENEKLLAFFGLKKNSADPTKLEAMNQNELISKGFTGANHKKHIDLFTNQINGQKTLVEAKNKTPRNV